MPANVNVIPIKNHLTLIFIQGQFIPSHLKSKMKTTICTSMENKNKTKHCTPAVIFLKRKKITVGGSRNRQKILLLNEFPNCIFGGC